MVPRFPRLTPNNLIIPKSPVPVVHLGLHLPSATVNLYWCQRRSEPHELSLNLSAIVEISSVSVELGLHIGRSLRKLSVCHPA